MGGIPEAPTREAQAATRAGPAAIQVALPADTRAGILAVGFLFNAVL